MKKRGKNPEINYNCPHKDKPMYAYGYCKNCWFWVRYNTDDEFKEKEQKRTREASKLYFRRKCEKHPLWNAKRQREYRKKHNDKFNIIMARCYLRRIPLRDRESIFEQIKKEEQQ